MHIVPQSAPILLPFLPSPFPLLPAPPVRLCLPAPKIAGLLPARCPRRLRIVKQHEPGTDAWWDDLYSRHGLGTIEDMNAQLMALFDEIRAEREALMVRLGFTS